MHPDQTIAMAAGLVVLAALYLLTRLRSGKGETMRFIVYREVPFSGTQHTIIRWGDAPEDQIALQAGDGEVAIPSPGGWSPNPNVQAAHSYNTATGEIYSIAAPPPYPTWEQNRAFYMPRIQHALRESEWAMLPDAPLSPSEVAEMATYRANLRAQVPLISDGFPSIDIPPPPYQEI